MYLGRIAVAASAAAPALTARGPNVPNDGHFEAVGEPTVHDVGNTTRTLLPDENLRAGEVDDKGALLGVAQL
ncbi:hypothetical protein [Kitasatospora sp. NPDC004531]